MPPSNNNDNASFLSSKVLSIDDDAPQQSQSPEYNEDDKKMMMPGARSCWIRLTWLTLTFLIPGGLILFSVALPLKAERILLKNLPKTINPSGISKNNFRVTIMMLNGHIEMLRNSVLSENATARSIHDAAKEALKRGAKSLDNVVKKMSMIKDDLAKTRAKLTNVSKKMRKSIFERNAAFAEKKTALKTIRTTKKELANAKNELADGKKDVTITKKDVDQLTRQNGKEASWGDSIDCYREKERIRLDAFEERTLITHRNKEKEDKQKSDAKQNYVSTIQALGGSNNPFEGAKRHSRTRDCSRGRD
jgi:hypothetical protein